MRNGTAKRFFEDDVGKEKVLGYVICRIKFIQIVFII